MEEQFFRLGVALAIGLLVGLERGWREREDPEGGRTAGLRTFGIFGLLGGIFAILAAQMTSPIVFAAGFLGVAALFGLFQFRESGQDGNFSVTGVMAGLGVFGLGGLAVSGDYRVAAAAGAGLAAVLASREVVHAALRRVRWIELRSALVLAVMTTIVLPVLPDTAIDPWGGFIPWEVWFFTVLVATISFAGYIAVRVLGPTRGLLLGALTGALASSTAVTVALARMANGATQVRPLVGAAALAGMVSVLRVLVVTTLLRPEILPHAAIPALCAAGVLGGSGIILVLRDTRAQHPEEMLQNPFELRALLLFAGLFAAASTASAALVQYFGGASLPVTSALSGMFDVDIAVLSALRLDISIVEPQGIAAAILVALASNGVARASLAVLAGPVRFWMPLVGITLMAAATGGIVHML